MSSVSATDLAAKIGPNIVRFVLLECVQGRSSKAYLVVVERDDDVPGAFRCQAAWGKIGGPSQSQLKQSGSLAICERRLEQLVREKQQRGYRVIRDERPDGKAAASPPEPVRTPAHGEESLEDILARRKREAAWVL